VQLGFVDHLEALRAEGRGQLVNDHIARAHLAPIEGSYWRVNDRLRQRKARSAVSSA
jgi:hypothetical protein